MIDKKAAFLAGVHRRCKQASFDLADEEQVARLLLMPPKQAAYILGQMAMDKQAAMRANAGHALVKLSNIDAPEQQKDLSFDSTLNPEGTPGAGRPGVDPNQPAVEDLESAGAPDNASPPPTTTDMGDTTKTDSDGQEPQPISLDDPISDAEKAEMAKGPQPIVLEGVNQENQRQGNEDLQREEIIRGFKETTTDAQRAAGLTPEFLADFNARAKQDQYNKTLMRSMQRGKNINFRPIPGGLRPGDIDPSQAPDEDTRRLAIFMQNQLKRNESIQRTFGGQREGWSTMGSSFRGGGERATRGRGPTQVTQTTQPAQDQKVSETGQTTAVTEGEQPVAQQKQPETLGQFNKRREATLREQGANWSIRGPNGEVVRSGQWQPKPQQPPAANALAPREKVEAPQDLQLMEKLPEPKAAMARFLNFIKESRNTFPKVVEAPPEPPQPEPTPPAPGAPQVRFNPETATWDEFKKWRNLMNAAGNAQWAQYWDARGINPGQRQPIMSQEDQRFVDMANPYETNFWTGMEGPPIEMHPQLQKWNPMLAEQIQHYNKVQQDYQRTGKKPVPSLSEYHPYGVPESWKTVGRDFTGEEKKQLQSHTAGMTAEQQAKLNAMPNDTQRRALMELWSMKDLMKQRREAGLPESPTTGTVQYNPAQNKWVETSQQKYNPNTNQMEAVPATPDAKAETPQQRVRRLNQLEFDKVRRWNERSEQRRMAAAAKTPPPSNVRPPEDAFKKRVDSRRNMTREQLIADEVRRWREAGERTGTEVASVPTAEAAERKRFAAAAANAPKEIMPAPPMGGAGIKKPGT